MKVAFRLSYVFPECYINATTWLIPEILHNLILFQQGYSLHLYILTKLMTNKTTHSKLKPTMDKVIRPFLPHQVLCCLPSWLPISARPPKDHRFHCPHPYKGNSFMNYNSRKSHSHILPIFKRKKEWQMCSTPYFVKRKQLAWLNANGRGGSVTHLKVDAYFPVH